ncbi:glycosyltransferase family 4 protein [Polymorphum gilvum]|uniref:Putative glycosyltransferase protein n=1 Tax=Polymorphum gilvum (strain LMG 25793 / CGMCC 1.9160 / SL003B-26A1) TaxID=991905 RepID=F2J4G5_POLGS|nr:glycosyltransferase family 4 protein [Polymorphum gilvum]ADZ71107.1 Putative glycosyltransferase protein [Polymorphum gilvum SL003B-26A1]
MKIAFTAPMKPLDDPVPSGDRTMGRLIVRALEARGHDVRIASRFRAWRQDGAELPAARDVARAEAERIAAAWQAEDYRPDLFLTYHLYHKAPDWVGPSLCDHFDIPYAIIEASRAPKRRTGPWAFGFAEADAALMRADAVAALHRADAECLAEVLPQDRLQVLPPFLDAAPFRQAATADRASGGPARLLAVGMMRAGDKQHSYRVLADSLKEIMDLDWTITLVGDGPARDPILSHFPPERVRWLGALAPEALPAVYAGHDLLAWPAIREAFGFVFLEAQAAGLAVAGGATFGVPDIVRDGVTGLLSPEGDVAAFAASLRRLISDGALRRTMGLAAARHIAEAHDLDAGARRVECLLTTALARFKSGRGQGER